MFINVNDKKNNKNAKRQDPRSLFYIVINPIWGPLYSTACCSSTVMFELQFAE